MHGLMLLGLEMVVGESSGKARSFMMDSHQSEFGKT